MSDRFHYRAESIAALLILLFIFSSSAMAAPPSDADIVKRIMDSGALSVKLSAKKGHKQWNADYSTWEYVRGVDEVIRNYPKKKGVKIKIVGDSVYQIYGNEYRYWKFRVISNEYLGMKAPSSTEVLKLVQTDLHKFVSDYWYNQIIGDIQSLYIADDPGFVWHSTNSMSLNMVAEYRALVSDTEVRDIRQNYEVRLYRDQENRPWKSFLSIRRQRKTSNPVKYTRKQVAQLKTLAQIDNERKAQTAASQLPNIQLVKFNSAEDLAMTLAYQFRSGNAQSVEAFLMKTLAPRFFVKGSSVGLNQRGADIINNNIDNAFGGELKYRDEYCDIPAIDKRRTSKKRIYFKGIGGRVTSQVAAIKTKGGYVDGVKQAGSWKINDLYIMVSQKPDDIDFFRSFSSHRKACPKD